MTVFLTKPHPRLVPKTGVLRKIVESPLQFLRQSVFLNLVSPLQYLYVYTLDFVAHSKYVPVLSITLTVPGLTRSFLVVQPRILRRVTDDHFVLVFVSLDISSRVSSTFSCPSHIALESDVLCPEVSHRPVDTDYPLLSSFVPFLDTLTEILSVTTRIPLFNITSSSFSTN